MTAHPELFFVPDDPAFGFYRPLFANTVCTLEEKDPSPDGEETKSTIKIFDKLIEDHNHRVDQPFVLRARLLDILIGDLTGILTNGDGLQQIPVKENFIIPFQRTGTRLFSDPMVYHFACSRKGIANAERFSKYHPKSKLARVGSQGF
jgi:hypothetical protein